MGRNSGGIRNTRLWDSGRGSAGKSLSNVIRDTYLRQMEPLLSHSVTVNGNGHQMAVGFTKAGNKHLVNDAMMKDRGIHPSDLPNMDMILSSAEFVKKSHVYKPRKDNIDRFYYYRAKLHGSIVYLNVAEESIKMKTGQWKHKRYLYASKNRIK